jgi:hypothetical protein
VSVRTLRLRRILGDSVSLGTNVAPAIVALDTWMVTGLAEPYEARGQELQATDFIKSVAGAVTDGFEEAERDVLKKSLEETLFIALSANTGISYLEARQRLAGYVRRKGRIALIEMFVTNQLWNVLWLEAGDVFGRTTKSPKSCENALRDMRQTCRLLVTQACRCQSIRNAIDLRSANEVVLRIKTMFFPGENNPKVKLDS